MIRFILNSKLIAADEPPGMLLLDLVRYREHLTGTKIGCREGDCGACTVLIGELTGGGMVYRSVTSCLTALGNVHQKHVVTIEGMNMEGLNPLQQAVCEEGGTQCGFCTPGFIVSMAGFCLSGHAPTQAAARAAVDGNICRCTGYKSIERALDRMNDLLKEAVSGELRATSGGEAASYKLQATSGGLDKMRFLVEQGILPEYFLDIPKRMAELALEPNGAVRAAASEGEEAASYKPQAASGRNGLDTRGRRFLGGGTDLYVQQHAAMVGADIGFLTVGDQLKGIVQEGGRCVIGGAATVTDLMESPVIRQAFPRFEHYARLISSTPIRNIATVAGNFVNASPIGDLTIFFLALDASLTLSDGVARRELPLRKFFKKYKTLDKRPEEFVEKVSFDLPGGRGLFHFEKVSKRTCLDIASVNTAMLVKMEGGVITEGHLSAGGVGPVPAYLEGTSLLMKGRRVDEGLVAEVLESADGEIRPISDARGTEAYKRLLLGQLIKGHFLTLFPGLSVEALLEI
ncbi:FAD binding domain-containing protein [Flavitalea sp. BT771]|uniref:FAD binding domain-containing protein n=1 Tax=Flavitalea sp. BT771 TaxID=3063329 RepID=UPI0026E29441|nr:FAD binding domain-containing protein [Flavitalea sp. BT771]MDO6431895.1 FAD binding domain-containing protein [Flavitalea sp. BT771]MDV6220804.1 FAD binding domain-containing protein [Flavitalea sp. BT771]